MAFQCVIVTPEQQVLDEQAKQVILPAHDGLMGVLTDRAPVLVRLGTGQLTVEPVDGQRKVYNVKGGVAQMKGNVLTVATTDAQPAQSTPAAV